jgi:chromosome segregation protein
VLKLEQLHVSGFKSFVDPVRLDFAGGMTGIVGPNGCGKSNLADAMIWVLGERSAKILRGQTMEDVIFGGAARRKPLGMAEVTLHLSTTLALEAADEGRISIGRRIFRDGDTHYLLNGRRTRLKEIRDLLMDTGLGVRAYSVIEQGRIGQILSGKPQERRRLLEEAAGITHYRERRRLAELKLGEAEANLSRLEDIVSEVERALRSLRRQAGAAKRYAERKARFQELLRQLLEARWAHLAALRAALRQKLEAEGAQEAEMTARLHRQEADLAAGREEIDHLAGELGDLHGTSADLAAKIEGKQEFLKGSHQRLEEIAERLTAGAATSEARQVRAGELQTALAELTSRESELLSSREQAASELTEDERRIAAAALDVEQAEGRLEELRSRLLTSIAETNGLRNRLHGEQVDLERGRMQKRHLEDELTTKRSELEAATPKAAEARAAVETGERQVAEAGAELNETRSEQQAAEGRLEAAEADRERLAAELAALENRREVLSELGRVHRERRESLSAAFAEAGQGEATFLSDRLAPPAGWEATLDLYFGELADAVLLPATADAVAMADRLASGGVVARLLGLSGGAAPGDAPRLAPEPDDPAVRASLGEALGLAPELAASLPPAFLVETAADAHRLARSYPGVAFLTRDRLWAQGGVLHVQGERARPGVFARAHELAEVEETIPPARSYLGEVERGIEALAAEVTGRRRKIAERETRLGTLREELAVVRTRSEELDLRERRLRLETDTLQRELSDVVRELSQLAERSGTTSEELERWQKRHADLEQSFDAAQKEVDTLRGERETVRTSGASRRGRLELLQERVDAHASEVLRVERDLTEARRQIEEWGSESERLGQRRSEIQAAMDLAEQELQEALEHRETTQEDVLAQQEKLDGRRAALRKTQEDVEVLRLEREATKERIGELRVEDAGLAQDGEHLIVSFREEFKEEAPKVAGEDPGEERIGEIEQELAGVRESLERLGPVNLLAGDEYDEQEERHTFLTSQRADVAGSVERLKATIREINETSSERFLTAFTEVNDHFRKTFTGLFRGGEAEMRLMDEDDLLECGIEIVARPPGKRLQNIMLMSGGEKALTAIALLFALFQTKPSPFCILDEVDAPLDDTNTLRFVELLKTMAKDTQFIVITHNKITMEAVSTLYGVTMQEKGVSNLVSVSLDDVQPAPEPAMATA